MQRNKSPHHSSSLSTNYDVIRAETLWTLYVVDNNMPFTSSDGFCDVVKTMFPDSKIDKDFAHQSNWRAQTAIAFGALGYFEDVDTIFPAALKTKVMSVGICKNRYNLFKMIAVSWNVT